MNLYNDLVLKFEKPDWSKNPEFGVIDTILELHPEIYHIFNSDIIGMKTLVFLVVRMHPLLNRLSGRRFIKR